MTSPTRRLRRVLGALAALTAAALAVVTLGAAAPSWAAGAGPKVAPYVDMGEWPTPSLSAMAQAGGVKSFTLAFVTSAGCRASWFNAYDPRSGWQLDEIRKIRAAGGDVKISFGGASGIELAQACGDANSLAAEYDAVVKAYQLRYADFDIEGAAVADPASVQRRSQALATVQRNNPGLKISLTLPVLPTGLTGDGLNVLRAARNAGVQVDLVNIMAMDYYQGPSDMGAKAIQAAKATQAQVQSVFGVGDATAWQMVGVTPMIGVNDSGNEVFSQQDARALVSFARQVHLGMLSFWEQGRDANACTGALYKCTNISQQPYEFARIFAGYTG
ncbi:chitinase [Gandjariella thermophila]|uniref:Sugar hydrolase n=1 Tax=Gandjariella thermophila TaxID=1931992 RepID=A0A4D4J0R2_9PSEU|nr:chitinase [Gandjariella thermophila]GDY30051.1 sugar hydrolase [Gandjariella thermophila]